MLLVLTLCATFTIMVRVKFEKIDELCCCVDVSNFLSRCCPRSLVVTGCAGLFVLPLFECFAHWLSICDLCVCVCVCVCVFVFWFYFVLLRVICLSLSFILPLCVHVCVLFLISRILCFFVFCPFVGHCVFLCCLLFCSIVVARLACH